MTFLFHEGRGLVEFSKVPELTSSFPPFLFSCFNPEAISGILIASNSGLLYLVLCISGLRSLAVLYYVFLNTGGSKCRGQKSTTAGEQLGVLTR